MTGNRVIVAGAGASGMAAAISAAEAGDSVLLLEASGRPGRKVLASGNGRCNLMNLGRAAYHGNEIFAGQVFSFCSPAEIRNFWNRYGLVLRTEGDLVYPYSLQASSVMDILNRALNLQGVRIMTGKTVSSINRHGIMFRVCCEDGSSFECERLIISTGGPAQPKLGGNEWAPRLLKELGHDARPFTPALTPLITEKRAVSGLAGIRVKCQITLFCDDQLLRSEKGELLFAEDGVSGICAMQCARYVKPGRCRLEVNLIPGLFTGPEDALQEFSRRRELFAAFDTSALLSGLCLPKLAFAVCKQAGFSLRGEKCSTLTEDHLRRLYQALTCYRIPVLGIHGFDRAQVSAGGLRCDEFNPRTMESLLQTGLHATGEALDVDGECGGYNLMFAWASGILAGLNGRNRKC